MECIFYLSVTLIYSNESVLASDLSIALPVSVSDEDKHLPSPFTNAPSASLVFAKEQQAKEKAHPPGTSKILSKARKKALEEEQKKVSLCFGSCCQIK